MIKISRNLLYLETKHTLAYLCPSPVLPGHSLIFPKQQVSKLYQLGNDSSFDLWLSVQRASKILEKYYFSTSTTIEVKDGVNPWLYINIIPRKSCDLEENDTIYGIIENLSFGEDNINLRQEIEMLKKLISN
ncbi:unnamed protein product [Blepharisma stoltei]|uniref:HIT domain-containing protein n=1 Tax=Blepharisma stoltei TaxID=1481888 RepID=A0AAU9JIF4_9CILI|nr:unnamed protein product [Blepharisma stoltei]